jgi:RimJ/RimL family protein N-acetyltransferase
MAGPFSFPDDVPTLTDGEVTLRAHRMSDVDEMLVQCTDPESIAWTSVPVPYTRDHAVRYATEAMPAGWRDGTVYGFAIETDRRFAGSCSLRPRFDGKAEIGFGLRPGARGAGVCKRAVKLLLDWGFQQAGIEVVVWFANVGNWGSRRVAWSTGFTIDATLARFVLQRGVWKDSWIGTLRAGDSREPKTPWHSSPVLESDRLRLRLPRESDTSRLEQLRTDDRTKRFMGRYLAADPLSGPAKVQQQLERNAVGESYNWTIADRSTDQLMGHVNMRNLGGLDPTSAELGYSVHPDARGRGVLTEALGLVTDWAFLPEVGFRRLFLGTAASNAASRHGAEKAGFVQVSTEPQSFPAGETGFEDMVIYHQLNEKWTPRP